MFDRIFERVYNGSGLQIPYAVLGNHDWRSLEQSGAAVINATPVVAALAHAAPVLLGARRRRPRVADDARHEHDPRRPRADPLGRARAGGRRSARWRVVVGHHSLFAGAHRGRTMHATRALLLPWLEKHRVDLYISGHSHHTEHLSQYGRTHFLVVEPAAASTRRRCATTTARLVGPSLPRRAWVRDADARPRRR